MTEEQVYLNAVDAWRLNKGIGTFVIPAPFDALRPLLYILPQHLQNLFSLNLSKESELCFIV